MSSSFLLFFCFYTIPTWQVTGFSLKINKWLGLKQVKSMSSENNNNNNKIKSMVEILVGMVPTQKKSVYHRITLPLNHKNVYHVIQINSSSLFLSLFPLSLSLSLSPPTKTISDWAIFFVARNTYKCGKYFSNINFCWSKYSMGSATLCLGGSIESLDLKFFIYTYTHMHTH